ncbi:hypothetical protein D3C73_1304310 [compost metagenome]
MVLVKALDTLIPAIEFSKDAFTSPISILVFLKASFILILFFIAYHINTGMNAKVISVSGIFIVHKTINDPISIINDINKSSGPWCANSDISIKSFIILDIITPVLLLSK